MTHNEDAYELASDFKPLPGEACFPPTIEMEVVGGAHIAPEIVTRHEGRFLMVEWPQGLPRHETERTTRFPHGLMRFGESLEDCAQRLVADQLGMEVSKIQLLHLDSYLDERNHWHIEPIVLAEVSGEPKLNAAAGGLQYFDGDDLPEHSVWSSRENFRRKVLDNI
jgi:8-oxo-dGTP pyrophosphatase MutT (NUDIX family)